MDLSDQYPTLQENRNCGYSQERADEINAGLDCEFVAEYEQWLRDTGQLPEQVFEEMCAEHDAFTLPRSYENWIEITDKMKADWKRNQEQSTKEYSKLNQ